MGCCINLVSIGGLFEELFIILSIFLKRAQTRFRLIGVQQRQNTSVFRSDVYMRARACLVICLASTDFTKSVNDRDAKVIKCPFIN